MKIHFVVPAILLAAAAISPASANWFSNPAQGVNRYIGSTPNPRPEDVRNNVQPVVAEDASQKTGEKKLRPIEVFLNELFAPKAKTQQPQAVAQTR
jgi:hypothetical protein